MTKETESFELTDVQKTRLLHIALHRPESDEPVNENEAKGDLLCDLLRCRLPLHAGQRQGPAAAAPTFSQGFRSTLGPPLGELLRDPYVSVATLTEVKEYAKMRGTKAESGREKDVYLVLYFAAIAAALVYHGERITAHTEEDALRFFAGYASAEWLPAGLHELFRKAEFCNRAT